jgi:uncharacterized membrane protein
VRSKQWGKLDFANTAFVQLAACNHIPYRFRRTFPFCVPLRTFQSVLLAGPFEKKTAVHVGCFFEILSADAL